jgi:cyclopropane fatty-acyl-phospholipid synthase-like methyltransferase
MGFYDDESNVNEYVRSAEAFDGRAAITRLREYLDPGSAVLELGMGPGTDLGILAETYQVTGSDTSEVFLRRYREKHPEAEVFNLDAVTINISRTFDCVYSNKVLYHLSPVELRASLERQRAVLREQGLSVHTFWSGSGSERYDDLLFTYYSETELADIAAPHFEPLALERYSEMEDGDSILLIARRR